MKTVTITIEQLKDCVKITLCGIDLDLTSRTVEHWHLAFAEVARMIESEISPSVNVRVQMKR